MATTWGFLKTTAFIVSLAIAFPVPVLLLGILRLRRCKDARIESEETHHIAWHCTAEL